MRLVIVTGMSGAGKTIALKVLEDLGFYCADNLPVSLVEKFAELIMENPNDMTGAALGLDIRSGEGLSEMDEVFRRWDEKGIPHEILFLDCSNEILIKRYKETRRAHPLAGRGRIDQGIAREREKLKFLKEEADVIIDTSMLLTRELRQELEKIYVNDKAYANLFVTVLSFGFKYGIPFDADLVFDVRFLPNPYYVEGLRTHTGEEYEVQAYIKQGGKAEAFMEKLYDMMEFLIPNYIAEGKNQLVIAVGCTGGKHRSVAVADELYKKLAVHEEWGIKIEHRDIDKDSKRGK
ncbi:RNase adapter RapZ [Lachnospiraceae bacterium 62-35]